MEQVYKAVLIPKCSATLIQEETQTTETMLNMLKASLILSQKLLSKSPHTEVKESLLSSMRSYCVESFFHVLNFLTWSS